MFGTGDPPGPRVLQAHVQFVLAAEFLEFRSHVLEDRLVDLVAFHVWDGPDAEFADYLGRDDCFGPGGRERAFDAVHAQSRVPPSRHEGLLF